MTIDIEKETLSLRKGQRISRPERLVCSEWKTSEKVARKKVCSLALDEGVSLNFCSFETRKRKKTRVA